MLFRGLKFILFALYSLDWCIWAFSHHRDGCIRVLYKHLVSGIGDDCKFCIGKELHLPFLSFNTNHCLAFTGNEPQRSAPTESVYLWRDFHSLLLGPLPCMPNNQCNKYSFQYCIEYVICGISSCQEGTSQYTHVD